jgi:hypothetical protein
MARPGWAVPDLAAVPRRVRPVKTGPAGVRPPAPASLAARAEDRAAGPLGRVRRVHRGALDAPSRRAGRRASPVVDLPVGPASDPPGVGGRVSDPPGVGGRVRGERSQGEWLGGPGPHDRRPNPPTRMLEAAAGQARRVRARPTASAAVEGLRGPRRRPGEPVSEDGSHRERGPPVAGRATEAGERPAQPDRPPAGPWGGRVARAPPTGPCGGRVARAPPARPWGGRAARAPPAVAGMRQSRCGSTRR